MPQPKKPEYKPEKEEVITGEKPELIKLGEEKGYISISRDGNRVTYKASGKSYNFKDPEEKVRATAYVELIEKYKYSPKRIDTEIYPPRREPKLPADTVVYEKVEDRAFIVVETKAEETDKKIQEAKREGLGNATLLDAKYLWIVCGSERFAYDTYEKPSLSELEKNRIADIPIAYGKEPKFKFKKGDSRLDLREVNFNELEAKFQLCHDEIWEGGKRDPAIAFDEMSKLMFAKIFDERFTKNGEYYRFQIGTHEDKRDVTIRVKDIYKDAQKKEPAVFKGEIELSDRLVFRLAEILQDISFSKTDLDAKGRAFEKFLTKIFRGEYGQYFTRREIVEFMVDMLGPTEDDLVIDPACGSGGFLLYIIDKVRKKAAKDYAGDKRTIDEIYYHFAPDSVFGIEINDRIVRIAMMDMVIHDDGHTNIENNDALIETKNFHPKRDIRLGKYTLLLTNPPFGAAVKNEGILKKYELGSQIKKRKAQRTEILFIERCLDLLDEGGRMGIVLPDGVLSNSTLQYVRDFVLNKAKILAIISLPQGAFVPSGAGVKASLLFLEKKGTTPRKPYPIFMSIAEHIGYDVLGRPDKNELLDILKDYKAFLGRKKIFVSNSFVVTSNELEGRLDCFYYKKEFKELIKCLNKSKYPIHQLGDFIEEIKYGASVKNIYVEKGISLLRILNLKPNYLDLSNVIQLPEERKKEIGKCFVKENDLLISRSGTIGIVAVVPKEAEGFAFGSFMIRFRVDTKKVDPFFISLVMNSDLIQGQIQRERIGALQGNITIPSIKSIKIPIPPILIQRSIVKSYFESKKKADDLKKQAEQTEDKANQKVEKMILGK